MIKAIRRRLAMWLAFGFLLMPGVTTGQVLSWEDCVRLAEAHNPRLVSAAASVHASEAGVDVAGASRLPQLGASGSATRSGDGVDGRDWREDEAYAIAVDVDQALYTGGRTRAERDGAVAELRRARASGESSAVAVASDVRSAFVGLLVAQEQITLSTRIAERRVGNEGLVRLRYESGREHRGSLALSAASLFGAQADVRQAARDLQAAREQLHRALGAPETVSPLLLVVTGVLDSVIAPPIEDWQVLARMTPAYQESLAALDAAMASVAAARGDRRPTVSAFGALGRSGDDDAFEDDRWSTGVRLSYPFWSGGRESAALRRAEARRRQAEADLRQAEDEQVRTLVEAHTRVLNALEAVTVQEHVAEATGLRAEIARKQYESGLLTFESWDIIENDLIQSRKSLLLARRVALLAETDWWRAAGRGGLRWAPDAGGSPREDMK